MVVSVVSARTRYARVKPHPPRCAPAPALPGRRAWRTISIGYSVSMTSIGVFMTFDMWTRMA